MSTRHPIPVKSRHIFKVNEPNFLCEEVLYVSSNIHPSGYKITHHVNKGKRYAALPHPNFLPPLLTPQPRRPSLFRSSPDLFPRAKTSCSTLGAEEAGRIKCDLTFLRTQNLIQPITEQNEKGKSFSYYEIVYDLWLIIEGRTLRFEARSPIDSEKVSAGKSFCIAAGFVPGTA